MGRPKGLLMLDGEPLLSRHTRLLAGLGARVVVVLGAGADALAAVLDPDVEVVLNPDWAHTGPSESLRLAIREAKLTGPCLVTPVDVIPARVSSLQALLTAGAPAVPTDPDGRDGHPVLLDETVLTSVGLEAPQGGLRTLLTEVRRVQVPDPLIAEDFDSPESWRHIRARWGAGHG